MQDSEVHSPRPGGGVEPSRDGFLEVMPRFRVRRFNQAKVERAFQAREKGEEETTVKKPHGRLPSWLGGRVSVCQCRGHDTGSMPGSGASHMSRSN